MQLYNIKGSLVLVKPSPLGGLGLFAARDIEEYEFITWFPGTLVSQPIHYMYAINVSKRVNGKPSFLDPFILGTDLSIGCGHMSNSSHPALPAPWNEANAEFVEYNKHPYVSIHAKNGIICKGDEILVDYHFLLTHRFGLLCNCTECSVGYLDLLVREHTNAFALY